MTFVTTLRRIGLGTVAACSVLASVCADANDPIVRIDLTPETITLGESARMQVTVLVPTWQPDPPVYPTFEIPNVITRLPPDSAHPTSQRIGGDTWSGIVRNYQVTPLIAANFKLGGETIRITWADPGKPNKVINVPVPTVTLAARVPEGAAELDPFLAGTAFSVERTVSGGDRPLAIGDALVIQYRARLDGMPALFIPPLAPEIRSNLVTAYPEEPQVVQAETAERSETVTLVLNHGGNLELPAQTFSWWNTRTEQIDQVLIEPLAFAISGPPPQSDLAQEKRNVVNERWLLLALLLTLVFGIALWRWLPAFLRKRREQAQIHEQSEAYAFEALSRAADPRSAYAAALTWLNRLDPSLDLRGFAAEFGDGGLGDEVDALSRALFENAGATVDLPGFIRRLGRARTACLSAAGADRRSALAPLNPTA